jgi:NADPH:quinone reductase-like Zn-dependent oxidoreductase
MKAMVHRKYGPPDSIHLEEVEKPVPGDNEVLIKIHAATVTAGDCELRRFDLPILFWLPIRLYMGLFKPRIKILGQELSGEIEATGKNVTTFKHGDQVFCPTDMRMGAYAEYKCLPATFPMAIKPANISFGEAATIPTGGANALHFLKKAKIQPGEKMLIIGAGGSIGTYAVQLAKNAEAEVTVVDSTEKLDMLRSIGADHVIDYTKDDFSKNGKTYDVIIEIIRTRTFFRTVRSLKKNGRFVVGNPSLSLQIMGLWFSITSKKKIINA